MTSFEPPVISTGRKRRRDVAERISPMKFRKVGAGWDISQRVGIPRFEDVEITPPPATPSPPRRSKRTRKKRFID